ncbi:MAG: hydrogenase formation protein HypD [Desulfobacterales bacterium]
MAIPFTQEYRDPQIARQLTREIRRRSQTPLRIMEVCGTHTVSIFRHGIRSLLPETITLLSGPGCPVCVTAQQEIDAFVALARQPDMIITTYGDLLRVPGSGSSLEKERAQGRDIRVVYSTLDALAIAQENPQHKVVFLGVGFETTAPTAAAALLSARQMRLTNFWVYAAQKTVPPALSALMKTPGMRIDGFLLPGHVSVIIGLEAYRPWFETYRLPAVVTGFEPVDILQGILELVTQKEARRPALANAYPRAVTDQGNPKARQIMAQVFETGDALWRGLGSMPVSGLILKEAFVPWDAAQGFDLDLPEAQEPPGCACGAVLTGLLRPPECPLYRKVCTPLNPVGPCMVSSEGTCAAYYRYHGE